MTLNPTSKPRTHFVRKIKNESKLTIENYEKLKKLTGNGFVRIYKNKSPISNS